ncbi:MAG: NADH-quinone oxidoreductase subunit C [Rhodanobacteraceae bacterium]
MNNSKHRDLAERLKQRFAAKAKSIESSHGETTMEVDVGDWLEVATALRDEPEFAFEQLMDLAGVDYLGYGVDEWRTNESSWQGFSRGAEGLGPGRFNWLQKPDAASEPRRYAVAAVLLSLEHNCRVRLRCRCQDNDMPVVSSLVDVWPGVNWFEREAFDLFGILFEGHPDLRRILTDYGFVGHPFRKDFPLIGNVEVRYDAEQGRVIYEPVTSVEPRVTVARVIRHDADLEQARAEAADNWREN